MTLKGKKNHYNVKLLRGYGCSIRLKDNKVVLRGGTDVFTGKVEIEEWFVTQLPYERIVVSGKGYLSTDAISLLSQKNSNVKSPKCEPYLRDVNIGIKVVDGRPDST
jgi:CRISPR-associated protein Cas1